MTSSSRIIDSISMASLRLALAFILGLLVLGGNAGFDGENNTIIRRLIQAFTIFPGTKWCGWGDVARNYDDLGIYEDTDTCCRDHDHCPYKIKAGESMFGLNNTGFYTRSACQCDIDFRDCLKNVSSFEKNTARKVGSKYFNVLRPQCFHAHYPIISCVKYRRFMFGRRNKCVEYNLDTTKAMEVQWFDSPGWYRL